MAKNYIDNLSEETRKGMQEKAEQGYWPSFAPLGYRNVTRADGRKIIEPDEIAAPLIRKLFEWYARGDISVKEAMRKARAAGLHFRKSGAQIPASTVHAILRNLFTPGSSTGTARPTTAAMRRWCRSTCGNRCRT